MESDTASHTARAVAAHRLDYDRLPAPYGDPAADDALARDVAGGMPPRPGRMHEYLRARTAFFDRVVIGALDRGIRQVVVGAAGYDGRAFRYAREGARWFEVDHPATQADKRERLSRLGLDARHITFVAADFTTDPVAARLRAAGLLPGELALFLLEGVAVYLDNAVTQRVLEQFRLVTPPGSALAISVSTSSGGAESERFRQRVAAMGEPARSVLPPAAASALLARAGWRLGDRAAPDGDGAAPDGDRAGPVGGRREPPRAGLLLARAAPDHPERIEAPPAASPGSPVTPAPHQRGYPDGA